MGTTPERARALAKRWYNDNKERRRNYWNQYRIEHPDRVKVTSRRHLLKRYGLTYEEYESLLKAQGGVCAVCGRPPKKHSLSVDHDHKTGKVRGILCVNCNRHFAHLNDDPELFRKAAAYLEAAR